MEKLPKLESNSENQAKVVDHIKGLLSDIVTNTVVDDNTETNMLFIKNSEGECFSYLLCSYLIINARSDEKHPNHSPDCVRPGFEYNQRQRIFHQGFHDNNP